MGWLRASSRVLLGSGGAGQGPARAESCAACQGPSRRVLRGAPLPSPTQHAHARLMVSGPTVSLILVAGTQGGGGGNG